MYWNFATTMTTTSVSTVRTIIYTRVPTPFSVSGMLLLHARKAIDLRRQFCHIVYDSFLVFSRYYFSMVSSN